MAENKERYLLDEYIIAKFLGVDFEDPAVERFLNGVREMLNLLVPNFLVDYSIRKGKEFDDAFAAYKEYMGLGDASLLDDDNEEKTVDREKVYEILNDSYFYDELEKRINEYFKKIYDKYVPTLDEDTKEELDEYIKNKNIERQKDINEMISQIDESLDDLEKAEAVLDAKLDKMRRMGGTMRS